MPFFPSLNQDQIMYIDTALQSMRNMNGNTRAKIQPEEGKEKAELSQHREDSGEAEAPQNSQKTEDRRAAQTMRISDGVSGERAVLHRRDISSVVTEPCISKHSHPVPVKDKFSDGVSSFPALFS